MRRLKKRTVNIIKCGRIFLLYDWMDLERTGEHVLASRLQEKGYHEILIYGWGYLGERLYRELENTPIKVIE